MAGSRFDRDDMADPPADPHMDPVGQDTSLVSEDIPAPLASSADEPMHRSGRSGAMSARLHSLALAIVGAPSQCPVTVVLLGLAISTIVAIVGCAAMPPIIQTNFDAFLKTDVKSSVMLDAFNAALDTQNVKARRLQPAESRLSRLLDEHEDKLVEHVRRLNWHSNETSSAPSRGLVDAGTLFATKDLFVYYKARQNTKSGLFGTDALNNVVYFEKKLRQLDGWLRLCGSVPTAMKPLCNPGITFVNFAFPTAQVMTGRVVPDTLLFDGKGADPVPLETSLSLASQLQIAPLLLPSSISQNIGSLSIVRTDTLRSVFRFKIMASDINKPISEQTAVKAKVDKDWQAFLTSQLLPLLRAANNPGPDIKKPLADYNPYFAVLYTGTSIEDMEVNEALLNDTSLAATSALFVLVYLLFHTRSILQSIVGILLTIMSVPLSYVLTAVLASTRQVTFATFISLFLVVGFGADVIFVYTDFWRDSAEISTDLKARLTYMSLHSFRASFATTATTALSFLSNLASSIRALRQFGFFMGLCVLLAWLLIAGIYGPLLLVDEKYFVKYRLRCCCCPGRKPEPSKLAALPLRLRCLQGWVKHLYRRKVCWICLSFILLIVFVVLGGLNFQISTELPDLFPPNHNIVLVKNLQPQYEDFSKTFVESNFLSTNFEAQVCNQESFLSSSIDPACALYWCEGRLRNSVSGTCECRKQTRTRCPTAENRIMHRFITSDKVDESRLADAIQKTYSVFKASVVQLQPMIIQVWETGGASPTGMYQSYGLGPKLNNSSFGCGTDVLCFCGNLDCIAQSDDWQAIPLGFQLPIMDPSRRLGNESDAESVERLQRRAPTLRTEDDPEEDAFDRVDAAWLPVETVESHFSRVDESRQDVYAPRRHLANYIDSARRRIVPESNRGKVRVVFGLKVTTQMSVLGEPAESDLWSYRDTYDLSAPWTQRNAVSFCQGLAREDLAVLRTWCWIEDIRDHMLSKGHHFPVLASEWESKLNDFEMTGTSSTRGGRYTFNRNGVTKAFYVSVELNIRKSAPAKEVLGLKKVWDGYATDYNDNAVREARGVFHVSDQWAYAEAQESLLESLLWTLVIDIVLAFAGMLVFTMSLVLSLLVVIVTLGVIGMLFFFIVVMMGWKIGLLEIIAVIYFVGYAVTYSLHVANKYSGIDPASEGAAPEGLCKNAKAEIRYRRTSYSMKAIGGATLGSAITTAGSSFFLIFCTITVFTRLGAMCLAVTVLSIFWALCPLPAVMMTCAPTQPGRRCRILLGRLQKGIFALLGHPDHRKDDASPIRKVAVESESGLAD